MKIVTPVLPAWEVWPDWVVCSFLFAEAKAYPSELAHGLAPQVGKNSSVESPLQTQRGLNRHSVDNGVAELSTHWHQINPAFPICWLHGFDFHILPYDISPPVGFCGCEQLMHIEHLYVISDTRATCCSLSIQLQESASPRHFLQNRKKF